MHKANAAPASHRVLAYLEGRQTLSGTINRKSIVALLLALLGSLYLWQIHSSQSAPTAAKLPAAKVHSKAAPSAESARIVHGTSDAAATTVVMQSSEPALTSIASAVVTPAPVAITPKRITTIRAKPASLAAAKSPPKKHKLAQRTAASSPKIVAKHPVSDPDAELLAKLLERRDPRADSLGKSPYSTQQQ